MNQEINRCKKCNCEIEPQYYYCEKCSNRRMKWQLLITILLSIFVLFIFSAIQVLIRPGGIVTVLIYLIAFGIIGCIWKIFINADSKLKEIPRKQILAKDVKDIPVTTLFVGKDIVEGTYTIIATHENGGFVTIYPIDSDKYTDHIYIKNSKKVKIKCGTKIKLINCKPENWK